MEVFLPIAQVDVNSLEILILSGVVGILSGLFGVGGGFLMTPFLIFLGVPPAYAVANEVELGKQWANNKIITNLKETFDPFGCLRRGEHITVLIKQTNKEIPGEFLGRLVLGVEDGDVKVFGATIY